MTATQENDPHVRALDHVAPVRHDCFEYPTLNSERAEFDAMHDSAGNPDEDDDSDPHPDRDAGGTDRPRREQHDRRVVARTCAGRCSRRDADHRRPARREHEPPRLQEQPSCGRLVFRAILGLPRWSRAKLAARASTEAAALPAFVIVIVRLAAPVSRICTGETEIAAAEIPAAITVRSP